ncbi:hypothetical protein FLX07_30300 [Microbispora bryophytorum]|nr:hypothetical protein FLX07_30300 [Microbispora bryophytorum]
MNSRSWGAHHAKAVYRYIAQGRAEGDRPVVTPRRLARLLLTRPGRQRSAHSSSRSNDAQTSKEPDHFGGDQASDLLEQCPDAHLTQEW